MKNIRKWRWIGHTIRKTDGDMSKKFPRLELRDSGEEEELEAYAGPRVESNNGKDLHCRCRVK